jgi:hypothetical protein
MRGSNGVSEPGRVGRQRAGDQRRLETALGLEQAGQRVGGGELRAVEQRQPFLRAERRAAPARRGQRLAAAGSARRRRRSRRRRSSPRPCGRAARDRPTRRPSPARDDRRQAAPASPPAARASPAHARGALRQAGRASAPSSAARSAPASARRRRPRATARCCAAASRGRGGDAHAGQLAEAGVDAVDRLALATMRATAAALAATPAPRAGIERDGRAAIDRAPVGQARPRPGFRIDFAHWPLQTRAWSGLKPMR